ncbi:FG-nucleoporin NUP1 SCDLUD_002918 [Saccharomycodes ludwigii]|uniref:FG-nucleoporin NUP1 n=1 Tax=Saccharomycodes ludwigii TaxID=36035 RepID=UPI001E828D24|nr:hypothetical protein SCDLUD_002918 [Saccharomycodes ludwigii]KAH3901425.1 hypothetical protein SCDLUD_002918 [Saccharomycodes ludwigii]
MQKQHQSSIISNIKRTHQNNNKSDHSFPITSNTSSNETSKNLSNTIPLFKERPNLLLLEPKLRLTLIKYKQLIRLGQLEKLAKLLNDQNIYEQTDALNNNTPLQGNKLLLNKPTYSHTSTALENNNNNNDKTKKRSWYNANDFEYELSEYDISQNKSDSGEKCLHENIGNHKENQNSISTNSFTGNNKGTDTKTSLTNKSSFSTTTEGAASSSNAIVNTSSGNNNKRLKNLSDINSQTSSNKIDTKNGEANTINNLLTDTQMKLLSGTLQTNINNKKRVSINNSDDFEKVKISKLFNTSNVSENGSSNIKNTLGPIVPSTAFDFVKKPTPFSNNNGKTTTTTNTNNSNTTTTNNNNIQVNDDSCMLLHETPSKIAQNSSNNTVKRDEAKKESNDLFLDLTKNSGTTGLDKPAFSVSSSATSFVTKDKSFTNHESEVSSDENDRKRKKPTFKFNDKNSTVKAKTEKSLFTFGRNDVDNNTKDTNNNHNSSLIFGSSANNTKDTTGDKKDPSGFTFNNVPLAAATAAGTTTASTNKPTFNFSAPSTTGIKNGKADIDPGESKTASAKGFLFKPTLISKPAEEEKNKTLTTSPFPTQSGKTPDTSEPNKPIVFGASTGTNNNTENSDKPNLFGTVGASTKPSFNFTLNKKDNTNGPSTNVDSSSNGISNGKPVFSFGAGKKDTKPFAGFDINNNNNTAALKPTNSTLAPSTLNATTELRFDLSNFNTGTKNVNPSLFAPKPQNNIFSNNNVTTGTGGVFGTNNGNVNNGSVFSTPSPVLPGAPTKLSNINNNNNNNNSDAFRPSSKINMNFATSAPPSKVFGASVPPSSVFGANGNSVASTNVNGIGATAATTNNPIGNGLINNNNGLMFNNNNPNLFNNVNLNNNTNNNISSLSPSPLAGFVPSQSASPAFGQQQQGMNTVMTPIGQMNIPTGRKLARMRARRA